MKNYTVPWYILYSLSALLKLLITTADDVRHLIHEHMLRRLRPFGPIAEEELSPAVNGPSSYLHEGSINI